MPLTNVDPMANAEFPEDEVGSPLRAPEGTVFDVGFALNNESAGTEIPTRGCRSWTSNIDGALLWFDGIPLLIIPEPNFKRATTVRGIRLDDSDIDVSPVLIDLLEESVFVTDRKRAAREVIEVLSEFDIEDVYLAFDEVQRCLRGGRDELVDARRHSEAASYAHECIVRASDYLAEAHSRISEVHNTVEEIREAIGALQHADRIGEFAFDDTGQTLDEVRRTLEDRRSIIESIGKRVVRSDSTDGNRIRNTLDQFDDIDDLLTETHSLIEHFVDNQKRIAE